MKYKASYYNIELRDIRVPAALILKQELLSCGGELAIPKNFIISDKNNTGTVLLMATKKQIDVVTKKIKNQFFGLDLIANELKKYLDETDLIWQFKNKQIKFSDTDYKIMGIVNITPDSFYDGGKYNNNTDNVLNHCENLIKNGADILDIGGQSTRPGSKAIDTEQEINRVIPAIAEIKKKFPDIPVSIDSTNFSVIEKSLDLGVEIINDISGLTFDKRIADLAKQYNTGLILMHIKGTPENMQKNPVYSDVINEISDFLQNSINIAVSHGVLQKNIVIDPGIGFGKTVEHNYQILKNLYQFKKFKIPVLLGTSNKSFIGKSLNLDINDRIIPTCNTNMFGFYNGASIFRVHNVKETKQTLELMKYIKNPKLTVANS
jgi:dihydropteroate synthase